MNERIAVNLARRGVKNLRLRLKGQFHNVQHAENARFHRLDGIMLIMNRARGTGEVVNLVKLSPVRLNDIMLNKAEPARFHQIADVRFRPGEKIVYGGNLITVRQESAAEMTSEKSGRACHQRFLGQLDFHNFFD